MSYTLGQAAKATGKTKATLSHAIKKGRFSAHKNDIGEYQIDPAELHRVYPPVPVSYNAKSNDITPNTVHTISALEAQVKALEILLDEVKHSRDEAETQAAAWRAQAEAIKLLVAAPPKAEKNSFWRRLVG